MNKILFFLFTCFQLGFAQDSKIEVQSAHASHISIAKIDSKNNLLITYGGYSDKSIKIWDLHSGLMLKSFSYTTTINNIFIDETNDRIFIGDINGIEILDSKTFEITKNIPIKFLKNYVYDSVSNLIYYVSGDAEFDGNNSFYILILLQEKQLYHKQNGQVKAIQCMQT